MKTVKELEQELETARSNERMQQQVAQINREADAVKRAKESRLSDENQQNVLLADLNGAVVASARYDSEQEGAIIISFMDGRSITVTASGDDMTHISWEVK